jgi:hypothetical protein
VKVVQDSVAIHPEAAFPLVAKLLGFSRVTEDMRNELLGAIAGSVRKGLVQQEGELLRVNG